MCIRNLARFLLCLFVFFHCTNSAQSVTSGDTHKTGKSTIVRPNAIEWKEESPGSAIAVLSGDIDKPGPFVARIKMPDGIMISPHWHPENENITVLEGTFLLGMGDKVDRSVMQEMPLGSYARMPRGMHHFVSCRGATLVQIHGMGPLVFNWVNPEDDASRRKRDSEVHFR